MKCVRDDSVCGTDKCSGCGACSVICSRHCIQMESNKNGFYRPIKDLENCNNCGLCEKVCPQLNIEAVCLDDAMLYSAYVNDAQDRIESSSGGIAYRFADYAVQHECGVCGVIMNYDKMQAEHTVKVPGADITALKGSKYLQSNIDAFSEVVLRLQKNKDLQFVVFGTPCQIAGLNHVLKRRKLKDRVTLVDIFCHGVPSNLMWRKYLKWIERKKKVRGDSIMSVTFRDKSYSWHKYHMHITALKNERGGGMRLCSSYR